MIRAIVSIVILLCSTSFVRAQSAAVSQTKGCTRAMLQTAVDSYLAAQEAGSLSKAPLASQVKYSENMTEIKKDQGLWNTPLTVAFHRSLLDVDTCRTFTEVVVTGDNAYVLGTRLKVEDGKISEIDSLITKKGDWLFNADNYLKYSKAEDWRVLSANERLDRQALIDAGNAYFNHFSDRTVQVPFGTPCARLEGGAYTTRNFDDPNATCDIGFPVDKLPIVNRSYVVDVDLGTVNIFCRFGNPPGVPDSHSFRLVNGKLRYVHTLSVSVPGLSFDKIMGQQPKAKPKSQAPAETK
jgi:type II secretory pathway pseudopilin PulG